MSSVKSMFETDPYKEQTDPFYFYKRSFVISIVLATLIIMPFVVVEFFRTGSFVFLYYGDYNVQQVPFYEHAVRMVHEGNFGWDWMTDLGSNFIGSYSYYLLGSPFFWLMCLFPASWAPYLMAPIYILKFACAGVTSYMYLQRFVKNKNYAVLGSLLYAFSGFQIYNVFFNQFHEVVVLFPLLLLGIEETIQNNRKGIFALAVALNAVCNYFMFAGQVAFCVIYFFIRCSHKSFRITLKKFLFLALEAIIGMLMAAVLFLPACLAIMDNPRIGGRYSGIKMFFYFNGFDSGESIWYNLKNNLYTERYGHIIQSLFYPPDIPSRVNFFYGHETRWASNAAWLPLFGMSGVFAYFKARKNSRYTAFIIILIACMLIPVLNSAFFLLNAAYYARWIYMLILIMVMVTIIALDDERISFKGGMVVNTIVCGILAVYVGLRWYLNPERNTKTYALGSEPFSARLWVSVLIAMVSMIVLFIVIKRYRRTKYFQSVLTMSVCVVIVAYSVFHIFSGKNHSHNTQEIVDNAINGEINIDDDDFYRIDFFRADGIYTSVYDNLGIHWQMPSVECFHTVVPPSLMNFYREVTTEGRGVGSRADYKYYGLRPLLSVKYSFIKEGSKSKHYTTKKDGHSYEYYDTQNNYAIFESNYFLDMGFTYEYFMTESEFKKISKSNRHTLLLKYLVVPDEERDYYSQFMIEAVNKDSDRDESYLSENMVFRVNANVDSFKKSYEEKLGNTCSNFEYSSYNFTAEIELDEPNIIFFSVPYESGWTAYINGEEATVKQVTYGFLSVEGVKGINKIEFKYKTPGLMPGFLITLVGILALVIYLLLAKRKADKPTYKFFKETYFETELEPAELGVTEAELENEKQNE